MKAKLFNTISGIRKRKWLIAGIVGMLILAAITWLWGPETVSAADPSDQVLNDKKLYKDFLRIILLFEGMFNKLLWPILFMIGGLLENDLIFNFGMETRLLQIWTQVRNIVNIFFVVVLVGVALYNVLGIGGEGDQFGLKTVLPKLLVAIIAVNLSFPVVRLMLDGVNALTVAVFALPESIESDLSNAFADKDSDQFKRMQDRICTQLYGPKTKKFEKHVQEVIDDEGIKDKTVKQLIQSRYFCEIVKLNEYKFSQKGQDYIQRYGSKNAAFIMAVRMGKVADFSQHIKSVDTISGLSINVLFSLLLYFVYVTSFLALFIVLIARLVILWISVALSPFLILSFALPGGVKESLGFLGKLQEYFMKHAFAPVTIGFPMTIGYIMMMAVEEIDFGGQAFGTTTTLDIGFLTSGISTLQEFIMAAATVGVIWFGVFTAAEGTIAQAVTDKLKSATSTVGKFLGTAPLRYIPWIPVGPGNDGKEEYVAPTAMFEAAGDFMHQIKQDQRSKASKLLTGSTGGNELDLKNARSPEALKDAIANNRSSLERGDPTALKYLLGNKNHLRKLTDKDRELAKTIRSLKKPTKENAGTNGVIMSKFFQTNKSYTKEGGAGGGIDGSSSADIKTMFKDVDQERFDKLYAALPDEFRGAAKKAFEKRNEEKPLEGLKDDEIKQLDKVQKIKDLLEGGTEGVARTSGITAATATGAANDKQTKTLTKELKELVSQVGKAGGDDTTKAAAVKNIIAKVPDKNRNAVIATLKDDTTLSPLLPASSTASTTSSAAATPAAATPPPTTPPPATPPPAEPPAEPPAKK